MEDEIIIKRGVEEILLSDKRLQQLASKFLEACADEATIHDDFGMNSKMVDMLIKTKQAFFPATQKNLNVNVESFDNKISKWMKAREEMKKAQEEGMEVVEIV